MQLTGTTQAQTGHAVYAVKVRSRGEYTVGHALRHKGFDILLPTYVHRRPYSDRIKRVNCALFPGYIFVRTDTQEFLPIVSTEGVSYIIKSGNSLHPLPQEEVTALESLCKFNDGCEPCVNYIAGQRVSIESGPLRGLQGVLARVGDNDRLVISINSIFSSVSIDVRDTSIKTID
jgi:transcriptional antiterminator NusG